MRSVLLSGLAAQRQAPEDLLEVRGLSRELEEHQTPGNGKLEDGAPDIGLRQHLADN